MLLSCSRAIHTEYGLFVYVFCVLNVYEELMKITTRIFDNPPCITVKNRSETFIYRMRNVSQQTVDQTSNNQTNNVYTKTRNRCYGSSGRNFYFHILFFILPFTVSHTLSNHLALLVIICLFACYHFTYIVIVVTNIIEIRRLEARDIESERKSLYFFSKVLMFLIADLHIVLTFIVLFFLTDLLLALLVELVLMFLFPLFIIIFISNSSRIFVGQK